MGRGKVNTKVLAQRKRKRRQWLTSVRMVRYGVNNFSRNTWLTVAATLMMTITLLVIMVTLIARNVLIDSVAEIRDKVDMSIYVKPDTPKADAAKIATDLRKLDTVKRVQYIDSSAARKEFANRFKDDPKALDALNEAATDVLPGTIRVNVEDINDTSQLEEFVKTNELLQQHIDEDRKPSFEGKRRDAIQTIGRYVNIAEIVGLILSIVFVTISSLIVFNTIRMAIFSRKEEIQMMKLIGADRSFIRGPFIVEAVMYGFIAAIFATGAAILGLLTMRDSLMSYGIIVDPTLNFIMLYIGFVLLGMIILGAIIGILSSLWATRKYLKI